MLLLEVFFIIILSYISLNVFRKNHQILVFIFSKQYYYCTKVSLKVHQGSISRT